MSVDTRRGNDYMTGKPTYPSLTSEEMAAINARMAQKPKLSLGAMKVKSKKDNDNG